MSGIIAQNSGRHTGLVKASSGGGGAWTLIQTQTASGDSTISFTSGIDSTYDEYCFKFINIHPATNIVNFTFQADTGTNTSYNQTMTTTYFRAYHNEADATPAFSYDTGRDQAQGTAFLTLLGDCGSDNDEGGSGTLHIFSPSSSTFVKHFIATTSSSHQAPAARHELMAGYFNTTTALTRFQFKMASGDIDAGTISLFGIG